MSRPKVYITRPLPREAVERIATQCEVMVYPEDVRLPPSELAAACREVEGLVACGAQVSAELLEQAPRLRVVSTVGVGYDNIDVEACTRRRILVTNTPGVVTEATADLCFALLMAVARRLVEADRYVRTGRWQYWQWGKCGAPTPPARRSASTVLDALAKPWLAARVASPCASSTTRKTAPRPSGKRSLAHGTWTAKPCCAKPIS